MNNDSKQNYHYLLIHHEKYIIVLRYQERFSHINTSMQTLLQSYLLLSFQLIISYSVFGKFKHVKLKHYDEYKIDVD